MLRDDLFALLAQRLGNRQDLIPRMETEVLLLQDTKLEQNVWLPWFLETDTVWTVTVQGDEKVQLPADFLGEIEEQALWRVDGANLIPLQKMDYDDMLARFSAEGTPRAYAVGNGYIFLWPVPIEEITLRMRYLARAEPLTSNIENVWLKYASDVVIAELGAVLAKQHMQHGELAATFAEDARLAWDRLYKVHIGRQETNRARLMEA